MTDSQKPQPKIINWSSEGEKMMYERALKWLADEKPSNEQIAQRLVLACTKTYELTQKQSQDYNLRIAIAQEFLNRLVR